MTNKNPSDTTTDCPLCRGEEVQPEYTVNNFFNSDSIGLRSRVTWRLSGTTVKSFCTIMHSA